MSRYFDKPLYEAAASLGMSMSDLKKLCREVDLKRWPYHGLKKHNIKERKIDDPFQVLGSFVVTKENTNTPKKKKKKVEKTESRTLPSFQTLMESIDNEKT
eukprot:gene5488-9306_t